MQFIKSLIIAILGIAIFRWVTKGFFELLIVLFPTSNPVVAIAVAVGIVFALCALAIAALKRK